MYNLKKTIQCISYLFLFILPWQTVLIFEERFVNGTKWEYGTLGIYGTEMLGWLLVLLFMAWYIFRLRTTDYRLQTFSWTKDRMFVLSLFFFILYSIFFSFTAGDSQLAGQHVLRILLGSLLFLLFYIGPIKPKYALWAFVLGSLPVSVLGIWQFLAQSTVASTILGLSTYMIHEPGASIIASESIGRWLRAYGSFSHPNVFGGYLALTLFSSLLLYKSSVRWGRVVLSGFIVLQSAALFFTFSRSAWMASIIGLLVYWFIVVRAGVQHHLNPPLSKGRKQTFIKPYVSIIATFILFTIIFFPLVQTRFFPTSQNEIASITERAAGYEQAVHLFQNNKWLGVGGGNYTRALIQAIPDMPGWWYQPVHVVPLLVLVEVGLVGIAFFLFVLVSFVRLRTSDFGTYLLLITFYLPLFLLDHYLWSSYVGLMFLFVYTALYFRYIEYRASPHIVPK